MLFRSQERRSFSALFAENEYARRACSLLVRSTKVNCFTRANELKPFDMIITTISARKRKTIGENIDYKTDKTIPDQSLTVQEILLNHTRGVGMMELARSTYFDGVQDFDDYNRLQDGDTDLVDIHQVSEETQTIINSAIADKKARRSAKKAEQEEEAKRSEADSEQSAL